MKSEPINRVLGAWLLDSGHTRDLLASKLGITRPTLNSRLKIGGWSWVEVLRISDLTGVTPNELAGM